MSQKYKSEENNKNIITYCYIIDKDDYKIKRPHSLVYPTSYPCVVESNKAEFCCSSRFIYDLNDFIYQNGFLYKKMLIKKAYKMIDNKLTNLRNEKIDEATFYFVKELKPEYDKSYELMSSPIKSMEDIKELTETKQKTKVLEYIDYIKNRSLKIQNTQNVLKIKQGIFEKMTLDFDGFHRKEMDKRIKKILKNR